MAARHKWLDNAVLACKRLWPFTLVQGVAIAGAAALLIAGTLAFLGRSRLQEEREQCASHLWNIGQAVWVYADDHGGTYPPDLATVLLTQRIEPESFVCRNAVETPTRAKTRAEQAESLLHGHCSYVYVGRDLTAKSDPRCVVAFEDPAVHNFQGSNVLFASGHVEFIAFPEIVQIVPELEQGHNPPGIQPLARDEATDLYDKRWRNKIIIMMNGQWAAQIPIAPATQPATSPAP